MLGVAGLTLPQGSPGSADTKFDLEIYFWDTPEGVQGSFVYSTELFESRTIERLAVPFEDAEAAFAALPVPGARTPPPASGTTGSASTSIRSQRWRSTLASG